MTTRNFRVNNGLEVGDIVISANANTITGGSTAAPNADGQFANKKFVDDKTSLTVLNTSVAVSDSGSNGTITNTADGGAVLAQTASTTTITASGAINLTAGTDVVVPANIGVTFGDGEKIEGDDTDLTITSGGLINLTATTDVAVPANVGITFGTHEKIESDDTDLTITVGSNGDINVGANIGITFGDDGEKIEGDGTDLTISSSRLLNLSATTDVVIPTNVGLQFTDANEKIESNGTALTINSGEDINLTCASGDVNIPADIGLTFGDDGEKIEGNGTNLTIASSGDMTLTATGQVIVTNNLRVSGDLTVDGTETIVNTTTLEIEDNIIVVNRNVSANSGMPDYSGLKVNRGSTSTATETDLFWCWDEGFADDGTTIFGNAGGAWTAFRASTGADNTVATPTRTETDLVDVRCNVIHATATAAQYADVAERFEADAPMSEGAVVTVGGEAEITEVTSELSDNVFGVISTQPAYAMNAGAGSSDTHPYVAMTGRTPVRVTGLVTKGQRLVSSSIKGTARALATGESISPFHVIGRALEDKTDTSIGLVNCAVRTNN
jgi:hypothetical protein